MDTTTLGVGTLPTLYKITGPNGEPIHGGRGRWSLPCRHAGDLAEWDCQRTGHTLVDGAWAAPGEWWNLEGAIEPCVNALHVTDAAHLDRWYSGREESIIHRVEVRGVIINAGDKYAVSSARLLPHTGGPVPDVAAAEAEYARIVAKAQRAYDRAVRKAKRPLPKVPRIWRNYVEAVGVMASFPKGHPAHDYAVAIDTQRKAEHAASLARAETTAPAAFRLAEVRASARLAGI